MLRILRKIKSGKPAGENVTILIADIEQELGLDPGA